MDSGKDFYNAYSQGFVRVAACTHRSAIGDPAANAESVLRMARECHDDAVALAVFPELTLSGYSIEDILLQDLLLDDVNDAVENIVAASTDLLPVLVVGAPLRHRHRIYNTAVVIHRGAVLGVAPKSYLPTYREFYERRQIAPGDDERGTIRICDSEVPFGPDLLFAASDLPGLVLHVEICEDMFVPIPPSAEAALAGATVLANLSGSPITIGRAEDRRLLARSASARCLAAYVYAAAGEGESTTDLAWDGQTMIFENGVLLAQSERFPKGERRSIADIDTELLRSERLRMGTFDDNRRHHRTSESFRRIEFRLDPPGGDFGLRREIERFPFVPANRERLEQDCYEAYNIQVAGLEQRLRALNYPKVVIGISGGLDSTHALIVAARAMDREERPRSDILAFTLPGFATGDRTKRNAIELCRALGVTFSEIDITETAELMLKEMDHPFCARREGLRRHLRERPGRPAHRLSVPARQPARRHRAGHRRPLRAGPGLVDLRGRRPDVALQRQCRRAQDAGPAPVRWVISSGQFESEVTDVLQSVLDTEITPELVPSGEEEELQSSEAKVGPFALQDFSLFHVLRYGFRPSKIAFLAWHAWSDPDQGDWPPGFPEDKRPSYSLKEIRHWLSVFVQRFYSFSQFKRSALPNGPKVSQGVRFRRAVIGGPRRTCRRSIWLDEIEREIPEE